MILEIPGCSFRSAYYPPMAEHPSFDRIAALQWQLDAFVHNQVCEGRLPESSLPQAEWGYVAPVAAPLTEVG